jgi:hypothetical protein
MASVRYHPPAGFYFSHMPAMPKGEPSHIAMANGCLAFVPVILPLENPSTGRTRRRARVESIERDDFPCVRHHAPAIGGA